MEGVGRVDFVDKGEKVLISGCWGRGKRYLGCGVGEEGWKR